ncbi:MAG TPA: ankyrin repeat domain-containing protein [Vicinamibacterales bacterium]|nr:ankyrin repeat domain-containing protein [Vicinamibacterales bacterium]
MMKRIFVGLLVLGTAVAAQDAGTSSDAFYAAIRANDLSKLRSMLTPGANPNVADPRGGATPLMYAAAIGSIDAMKLLLDQGADANLKSSSGATALMWAVTDIDKVRLLLDRGADVKAASQRGRTALHLASRSDSSEAIVRLLMSKGADPKSMDAMKSTALVAASVGNDTGTIRLMVDAGVDVNAADFAGFTPLIYAATNGNLDAVRLLLSKGANVNARSGDGSFQKVKAGTIALGHWTPLNSAAAYGSAELVKALLDAGAQVDTTEVRGMTPLMLAVASDRQNREVIRMLIARGADVKAKSLAGETALDWARKIGAPDVIQILTRAGGIETPHEKVVVPAPAHADLKASVERSLALLRSASVVAAANGGCASCHSQNIVDIAEKSAKSKGLTVDAKLIAQRQTLTKAPFFSPASLLDRMDPPVPDLSAYALIGLASGGYPPDQVTDAITVNLMAQQRADGAWLTGAIARPPIEDGQIFRTALVIRALSLYGPPGRGPEIQARIARARAWLAKATPVTAEDRNMQLLGLHWAALPAGLSAVTQSAKADAALVKSMLARQRPDGGWAQSQHLSSDAYATGQTLYALAEASGMKSDHPAFKKGVAYLLSTQRADGSWYVSSRSPKFQPYFDGGFPYGHDQWVSSMATGWAATALAYALPSP